MIRFAAAADLTNVVALWNRCFDDDSAFSSWFFANRYRAEETLLYLCGDQLCAMVQMMPYELESSEVTYIYGACTAPEYRKQGIMAELLQASFSIDREKKRTASILIPAEEWLFNFYKKYGYETAFYTTETVWGDSGCTDSAIGRIRPLEAADIPSLDALYEASLAMPHLHRTTRDWNDQLAMFSDLGGRALGWFCEERLDGYAFIWKNEDGLWAQEAMSRNNAQMKPALLRSCGVRQMKVTLPGTQSPLGCIRYHKQKTVKPSYFNLLFN